MWTNIAGNLTGPSTLVRLFHHVRALDSIWSSAPLRGVSLFNLQPALRVLPKKKGTTSLLGPYDMRRF